MTHVHRETHLDDACDYASQMAIELQKRLPPVDAAGLLISTAVGVLSNSMGSEKAAQCLRQLADEVERNNSCPRGRA